MPRKFSSNTVPPSENTPLPASPHKSYAPSRPAPSGYSRSVPSNSSQPPSSNSFRPSPSNLLWSPLSHHSRSVPYNISRPTSSSSSQSTLASFSRRTPAPSNVRHALPNCSMIPSYSSYIHYNRIARSVPPSTAVSVFTKLEDTKMATKQMSYNILTPRQQTAQN